MRNRPGAQRGKADENATSRHIRQPVPIVGPVDKGTAQGRTSFTQSVVNGFKVGLSRPVLNEVTAKAVNRKVRGESNDRVFVTLTCFQDGVSKVVPKEKETVQATHKRTRSWAFPSTNAAQRVPLAPVKQPIQRPPPAPTAAPYARPRLSIPRVQVHPPRRFSRVSPPKRQSVKLVVKKEEKRIS